MKKIGLIGYGNIARRHLEVFRELNCDIVASVNRSEEKNLLARNEGHIPVTFTDVHEMIKATKPDGLVVCASFWNMYQVLKKVIPYGLPVLAEKPTATSWKEHQELCVLAEKHGTKVMVGLNRRHYSVIQKAVEDAGGKDAITSVLVEWSEDPYHLVNNRKLTREQVERYIFGNTIHGLDLMTWLAGNVHAPNIAVGKHGEPYRWLMNVSGLSDRGVLFNFNSSWDNPVPWRVVFTARGKRYLFAPLEKCLKQQQGYKDMVEILPDNHDVKFKAGFYKQASSFINGDFTTCDIHSVNNSMQLADSLTQKLLHE